MTIVLLVTTLSGVVGPAPASAQIASVQNLGTVSGVGAMSYTITTTGAVTAGNSIIVSIGTGVLTPVSLTCSDPVNGACNTDVSGRGSGSSSRTAICSKHDSAALPAGTLITVASSATHGMVASASEFTGLAASGALDRTAAAE